MDRIKIRKNFGFALCKGEEQYCSFSMASMTGRWGLSIAKNTGNSNYNVWIYYHHLHELSKEVKRWIRKMDELIEQFEMFNKRVALRRNFGIGRCRGSSQKCSYCECNMSNKIGLSISKQTSRTSYNIWICLDCLPQFARQLRRWQLRYEPDIIIEAL